MGQFKPFARWLYAKEPVYSFHAGIPLPPDLGVVMLKRPWSGEMSDARIGAELRSMRPGLVLLRTDSAARVFRELLVREYQLVYQGGGCRLYVHRSIAGKVSL
jgi:hypothetical protein